MCGRFALYAPVQDLVARFAIDEVTVDEVRPRWNIAPSQQILAIAMATDGETRRLGTMRWGLVPSWAKDPSVGNRMINARAETLATRPSYRAAYARRRCVIPGSGFYEWQKPPASHGKGARSQPFFAQPADGKPLGFAGLWERWTDAEGQALTSCTIVTTTPNGTMSSVHDRMPAILTPQGWERWLAPEPLTPQEHDELLGPASDDLLTLTPVSTQVNRPINDGPELIEATPTGT